MEKDPLTGRVIGLAIEVHRVLGPGLLESTYLQCLAHELHSNGIPFLLEHPMPIAYKAVRLDCGYRIDLLVDGQLILELKAVEAVRGLHIPRLLTCTKPAGIIQPNSTPMIPPTQSNASACNLPSSLW